MVGLVGLDIAGLHQVADRLPTSRRSMQSMKPSGETGYLAAMFTRRKGGVGRMSVLYSSRGNRLPYFRNAAIA